MMNEPQQNLDSFKEKWSKEQLELKQQLCLEDHLEEVNYIGGVDISFVPNSETSACSSLVILSYPSFEVVYSIFEMVELTLPYISGFLAFREVPHLLKLIEKLRKDEPKLLPQLIMVDGNGILHPVLFGLACHLGVLSGIPTIGVCKKLLYCRGITEETVKLSVEKSKTKGTDAFLTDSSGKEIACALRIPKQNEFLYVSLGTKIDLPTSVALVKTCLLKNKVPEPIFQADWLGRAFLQQNYEHALN